MLAQNTQKNADVKATQTQEKSDFSSLLAQEFKSKTEQSKTAVQNSVKTLA